MTMNKLHRAIEIATEAHKGQHDKSGKDYIGHPLRVMEMGKTEDEKIVGVLHDVVEDSEWTFEMLEAEGFSEEVMAALRCVTKISEKESYDDFIERVKKNPLAVSVKINDLTDNMDIRRLPYLSDKDVKRLKKYLKAYKRLTGEPVYSVYAARQEHPNAYDPWTEETDNLLKQMWAEGISVHEIAEHFGRKSSAIITRMKKLGI
jgi:(p)ppGpp synthase/HD superfamily hydrolase